jgi:sec-independent protein translocase protein TatA
MFHQIPLFLNLGTPELIVIMFVVLLLFGGKKLPELAKGLGKGLRDFKEASEGLKTEINNQINAIEESKPEAVSYNPDAASYHPVPEEEIYSDYRPTETVAANTVPDTEPAQAVAAKTKTPRKKLKSVKS